MSHKPTTTDSLQFPAVVKSQSAPHCWVVGLLIGAIGFVTDLEQSLYSYLVSFVYFTGIGLASVFMVMFHHITKSKWGIVMRRIPEVFGSNLKWWTIAFLPILGFMTVLYHHWTDPTLFDPESTNFDYIVAKKEAYLNVPFFIIRQIIFTIWGL